MMKRWIALLLCLCMALSLAACGTPQQQNDPAGGETSDTADVSVPEQDTDNAADVSGPEQELDDVDVESEPVDYFPFQAFTLDGEKNALDGSETNPLFMLTSSSSTINDDDGTLLVTSNHQVPQIMLDNQTAQTAIQADLDKVVQDFMDYVDYDLTEQAREMYSVMKEESADGSVSSQVEFSPLYADLSITVVRFDEKVLSVVFSNKGYSGGAHGWDNRSCANYDLQTGEKITFAMLGEGFRAAAEERVLALADEMQAETGVFFEDYANSIPTVVTDGTETLNEVYARVYPDLYGPDASGTELEGNMNCHFYLTDEGVTFISGEYAMQSYAAGIIEFPIPYEDFAGIMDEQYVK